MEKAKAAEVTDPFGRGWGDKLYPVYKVLYQDKGMKPKQIWKWLKAEGVDVPEQKLFTERMSQRYAREKRKGRAGK